ncbi:helix-turn-helix transcriptional regulator [Lysinibacillus sphaericus]|uniref:helix-turn-helix transcriptional regulator n=1 Tax=Lysinibacillus sphaericus TaxID=1421 RepID=UPI003F799D60
MGWSMTKPKRKKKRKEPLPSDEFRHVKGAKRERMIVERKARKLSQAQLGKKVGCSAAMIGAIESGRANPGLEVSMELELVLETPFFELFPDL